MARIPHGAALQLEEVHAAIEAVKKINENSPLPVNAAGHLPLTSFGYMFGGLQAEAGAPLPDANEQEVGQTVANLKRLGVTMRDDGSAPDSGIPSLYTYFGQFLAHDITLEAATKDIDLDKSDLKPLTAAEVGEKIKNTRTADLDLDSVYGNGNGNDSNSVPRDLKKEPKGQLLKLGPLSRPGSMAGGAPAGSDNFKDVPREGYNPADPAHDRAALIGDPRNDENAITSQLHVAFLRAHNAIVKGGRTFEEASVILRQHFQWIVFDDFLKRVADPDVVDEVLADPHPRYNPPESDFFLPLEFTAAAYRFGHSMIRASYEYNHSHNKAGLAELFNPLGKPLKPGGLGKKWITLPDEWAIEWENFVDGGKNFARRIDTQMVEPLFELLGEKKESAMASLAVRNLLRGYILRLPTGQAVARELGLVPLTEGEVVGAAATQEQKDVLAETGLAAETPLWFYVLAEAAHERAKAEAAGRERDQLGPVGSRIVAEVLIALIRKSDYSVLRSEGWEPTLPKAGARFTLPDILRLAGVMN